MGKKRTEKTRREGKKKEEKYQRLIHQGWSFHQKLMTPRREGRKEGMDIKVDTDLFLEGLRDAVEGKVVLVEFSNEGIVKE